MASLDQQHCHLQTEAFQLSRQHAFGGERLQRGVQQRNLLDGLTSILAVWAARKQHAIDSSPESVSIMNCGRAESHSPRVTRHRQLRLGCNLLQQNAEVRLLPLHPFLSSYPPTCAALREKLPHVRKRLQDVAEFFFHPATCRITPKIKHINTSGPAATL